jgi:hypothetical protein
MSASPLQENKSEKGSVEKYAYEIECSNLEIKQSLSQFQDRECAKNIRFYSLVCAIVCTLNDYREAAVRKKLKEVGQVGGG